MGFPGPGGTTSGSFAPHVSGAGLYHVGYIFLSRMVQSPGGVRNPGLAVATGNVRRTCTPSYRVSWFSERLTPMVRPSDRSPTFGAIVRTGKRRVVATPPPRVVAPARSS